jgi:hypothetical protein
MFAMDDGSTSQKSNAVSSTPPSTNNRSPDRTSPEQIGSKHGSFVAGSKFRNGSFTAALGLTDVSLGSELGIRLASGYCTRQGPRKANEDRLIAIPDMFAEFEQGPQGGSGSSVGKPSGLTRVGTPSKDREMCGYFAVYDGHCGDQASTYLERELHTAIYRHPLFWSDLETAVTDSCLNIDKAFLQICKDTNTYAGTTALGALVRGNQLTVFNIGDCQAVLSSGGQPVSTNFMVIHRCLFFASCAAARYV